MHSNLCFTPRLTNLKVLRFVPLVNLSYFHSCVAGKSTEAAYEAANESKVDGHKHNGNSIIKDDDDLRKSSKSTTI